MLIKEPKTTHIVSFSGGKDSTAMLLMMIEKGMQIDRIITIDTTKEFPETYEHIKKVQKYIKPYEITFLKIKFDYYFSEHIKTIGKRKGKKGYGWPRFRNRWCTALKRQALNTYIKKNNFYQVIEYQGIAYDEKNRCKNNDPKKIKRYPLVEWFLTEKECLQYCYSKGFNWENLYKKIPRVSCYCCPMQRTDGLRVIYNEYPILWKNLQEMDKKTKRRFKERYTLDRLTKKFEVENRTPSLFDKESFYVN
jgi:3'-phosphoadenosine 5'-phosphosulfate sulfotransferase (PAPS reductase)/FAD synthetase